MKTILTFCDNISQYLQSGESCHKVNLQLLCNNRLWSRKKEKEIQQ